VGRLGDLSHRLSDLQSGSRRQAVDGEVEVDDQLITGKLPAIAVTRDRGKCSAIHDGDLPEQVRPAVGSASGSGLPTIPAQPVRRVEHALRQHPSLVHRRPANDHLDNAVIGRRAAHAGRDSLDVGERTMEGNMLGEPIGHAGFDRAHDPLPLSGSPGVSSEDCFVDPARQVIISRRAANLA
jgi:hypothetical protein